MRNCLVILKNKAMNGFRTSRANFHTPITEPWHMATVVGGWGHMMTHFKDLENSGSGEEKEMTSPDTGGQG